MTEEFEIEPAETSFNVINFYFSPKGRLGRAKYWLGSIPLALVVFAADYFITEEQILPYLVVVLPVVYMGLTLNIKRSHDRNRSGWFTLLFIVPIVSLWPTIELGFFKGTEGPNRFGSDPVPSSEAGANQSPESDA